LSVLGAPPSDGNALISPPGVKGRAKMRAMDEGVWLAIKPAPLPNSITELYNYS